MVTDTVTPGLKNALLSGVCIAAVFLWLTLLIGEPGSTCLIALPWPATLAAAVAGFFTALTAARFVSRRAAVWTRCAVFAVLVLGGFCGLWVSLSGAACVACAYGVFSLMFFLLMPLLAERSGSIRVFQAGMSLSVALALLYGLVLRAFVPTEVLTPVLLAVLPLGGGVSGLLAMRAPPEEAPAPCSETRPRTSMFLLCAAACLSAVFAALEVLRLMGRSEGAGGGRWGAFQAWILVGALFFIVMIWLYGRLCQKGRYWQACYIVFTSFCLGVLFSLLFRTAQSDLLRDLPSMLYVVAGAGMLVLFFSYAVRAVSPVNRGMMCGLAYILCLWALTAFIYRDDLYLLFSFSWYGAVGIALTVFVLMLAPILFRDLRPEAAAQPAAESEAPPRENRDVLDVEKLTQTLTNAEKRVFFLILSGYSNQQIANELYISINTVKFHIRNVLSKVGVQKKRDLVAYYLNGHPTEGSLRNEDV